MPNRHRTSAIAVLAALLAFAAAPLCGPAEAMPCCEKDRPCSTGLSAGAPDCCRMAPAPAPRTIPAVEVRPAREGARNPDAATASLALAAAVVPSPVRLAHALVRPGPPARALSVPLFLLHAVILR